MTAEDAADLRSLADGVARLVPSGRADVHAAILRLYRAAADASAISALPAEIGGRVTWANGVTWTRIGDNAWLPNNVPAGAPDGDWTAPSLHIASGDIIATCEP